MIHNDGPESLQGEAQWLGGTSSKDEPDSLWSWGWESITDTDPEAQRSFSTTVGQEPVHVGKRVHRVIRKYRLAGKEQ